jgi:antitoxin component YwqK of YwqJK toxin-antitoxin module
LLGLILFSGCKPDETKEISIPSNITRKTLEFHKSGKPKTIDLYVVEDGKKKIYGFEELYEDGQIKIKGNYDKDHQRNGLWESFYIDGTKWSIGEYNYGVESGEKKVWYPNGKMRYRGEIKDGKPVGKWSFWDKEGQKEIKEY